MGLLSLIIARQHTQLTCGGGRSSSHFESATISRYRDAEAGLEIHLETLLLPYTSRRRPVGLTVAASVDARRTTAVATIGGVLDCERIK